MTPEEAIIKNNIMLAKYMGFTEANIGDPDHIYLHKPNELGGVIYRDDSLLYHKSWDWLLPVIRESDFTQYSFLEDIESVYWELCEYLWGEINEHKTFESTKEKDNKPYHLSREFLNSLTSALRNSPPPTQTPISNESFFDKAYDSLKKMQIAKDKNYGNSALQPLDIFAKHHSYGSRIDEKLARIKYSIELRKNDVADIIGGLMLLCKDNDWDNFEDLID